MRVHRPLKRLPVSCSTCADPPHNKKTRFKIWGPRRKMVVEWWFAFLGFPKGFPLNGQDGRVPG